MMIKDPKKGELVENNHTYEVAKVIEVNNQFGWFKVQYLDDRIMEHRLLGKGNSSFNRLRAEERADFLLRLERLGITDFWRD